MNLHVLIVHYPVAFLTVYSVLELIRFQKVLNLPYWFYVKAVLVITGTIGALGALLTGDLAAELIRGNSELRRLINTHESFAQTTAFIFAVIAVSYLIAWFDKSLPQRAVAPGLWVFFSKAARFIFSPPIIVVLAAAGLASITITGGLGGIIAFGDKADPFFGYFYNLFLK